MTAKNEFNGIQVPAMAAELNRLVFTRKAHQMRIALTTTSFRQNQGAERFVINLAKGLLGAGEKVHLIGRLKKPRALEAFLNREIRRDFKSRLQAPRNSPVSNPGANNP